MGIKKTEVEFLAGLKGPRHWSEEDAPRAIALQEGSGESRAAFARRHGLRATRFGWTVVLRRQNDHGLLAPLELGGAQVAERRVP